MGLIRTRTNGNESGPEPEPINSRAKPHTPAKSINANRMVSPRGTSEEGRIRCERVHQRRRCAWLDGLWRRQRFDVAERGLEYLSERTQPRIRKGACSAYLGMPASVHGSWLFRSQMDTSVRDGKLSFCFLILSSEMIMLSYLSRRQSGARSKQLRGRCNTQAAPTLSTPSCHTHTRARARTRTHARAHTLGRAQAVGPSDLRLQRLAHCLELG